MLIRKKTVLFLLVGLALGGTSYGQMILEELSVGHRKTGFNQVFKTDLGSDDQYTLNGFGFFYKYYGPEDRSFDELGIQAGLFRDIIGGLKGGVAVHHNSIIGLQKKLALQYTLLHKPFRVLVRPSLVHVGGKWNQMVFINTSVKEPLHDRIALFGQFRFQMFWDPKMHNLRSFQRFRLGLSLNDAIKIGASVDLDQFKGPEKRVKTDNYGIFLQKMF